MARQNEVTAIAQCGCGRVAYHAAGKPIACVACYCDDCQAGSHQVDALGGASPVCGADGGTAYVLYRKDRVACVRGADLLRDHKLKPESRTVRVTASCCNSAMVMRFEDSRFWVSMYRTPFAAPPPVQMRIATKFKPASASIPADAPSYRGFPFAFVGTLLRAWVPMLLGRP
ncbi:MAG: GFA family protein [Pseudomonadota bacterium]